MNRIIVLVFMISAVPPTIPQNTGMRICKPGVTYKGGISWFIKERQSAINPNAKSPYCACQWDYKKLGEHWGISNIDRIKARIAMCKVRIWSGNGRVIRANPCDAMPSNRRGRGIDVSRDIMEFLNVETDDIVHFRLEE